MSRDMWSAILVGGSTIAGLSIVFLKWPAMENLFRASPPCEDLGKTLPFMSSFFALFIFLNNFNKFNARTPSMKLWGHILQNRGFLWIVALIFAVQIVLTYFGGESALRTTGLTAKEWMYVLVLSAVIIPIDLARKALRNLAGGESA